MRRASIWAVCMPSVVRCMIDQDGVYVPATAEPHVYVPTSMTTNDAGQHEELPPEYVVKLLEYRLRLQDTEVRKDGTNLMTLDEFIMMSGMDCRSRLLLLHAMTYEVVDFASKVYQNATSIGQMYWMMPSGLKEEETSWVWLTTTCHQRLLQRMIAYFSKAEFFALEDRGCLPVSVRRVLAEAVGQWKQLETAFSSLIFNGFAFGLYGDIMEDGSEAEESGTASGNAQSPAGARTSYPRTRRSSFSANGWMTVLNGNMWSGSVVEFAENHAARLTLSIQESLVSGAFTTDLGPTDGTNPAGGTHQEEGLRLQELQGGRGMFGNFEVLRRQIFQQWAVDKGLLRGLLRYVLSQRFCACEDREPGNTDTEFVTLPTSLSLADFGAGAGKYTQWLNDTGLVSAFAFDGGVGIGEATQGQVAEVDIAESNLVLWRTFDWILCLEVAEHVPDAFLDAFLDNIGRHLHVGLVMSWSPDTSGIGHIGARPEREWHALVTASLGLVVDVRGTALLRAACQIDYLAQTVTVFRRCGSQCAHATK